MKGSSVFGKVAPFVLAVAIVIVAFVAPTFIRSSWAQEEDSARSMVEKARVSSEQIKEENVSAQAESVNEAIGFDKSRFDSDSKTIKDFLTLTLTWNSCAEYNAAREEAIDKYGTGENCQYFTKYMPYMEIDTVNGHGETISGGNVIDSRGLNRHFDNADVYYVSEDKSRDAYEYLVEFVAASSEGSLTKGRPYLLHCFVDKNNHILDAHATMLS